MVSHDRNVQALMDARCLAWGVIYEIARGVTRGAWKWSDVTPEKLDRLKGTNVQSAYKVNTIIGDKPVPIQPPASDVWAEYDREEKAIKENLTRGLGLMGEWEGQRNWYGGSIQQRVRLVKNPTSSRLAYSFQLEKPEIRRSNRFSRFLGSRRMLQLSVPDDLLLREGDQLRGFLSGVKLVLCGRIYVPFHAKDNSLYMMESDEDYQRKPLPFYGDEHRLSFAEFVKWHNPLSLNSNQPISKWSTRWALGLSTSVPVLEFAPEDIFSIDDKSSQGKPPAAKCMTDGCGFINGAGLTQIMRIMEYPNRPTAVQGRIAGSKGMWVLHPDPSEQFADGPPKIWIRPSQDKIKLPPLALVDRAHLIFDLLAPSRTTIPSRISAQTIVNLSFNGVPNEVITSLMKEGLGEEVKSLTEWNGPDAMVSVWRAVERAGHVVHSRLRKRAAGQARALGLGRDRSEKDAEQDSDDDFGKEEASSPLSPGYDGQPSSVYESAMTLIQAGFHPINLQPLFDKLKIILTMVINQYVSSFHMPVQESADAYIIPDPFGVLKEGEIHFRSSESLTNPATGAQFDTVRGEVLVTAVSHPKLDNYYGVIVFSTKGDRSLASWLGGGDTVTLIWSKPLVDSFKNSPFTEELVGLLNAFESHVESVMDFDERVVTLSAGQAQKEFQTILLLGLAETKVGLYSKFHDLAAHKSCRFTTCLDSSKTGLRVRSEIFKKDHGAYASKAAYYMKKVETSDRFLVTNNTTYITKRHTSEPFILDVIVHEGLKLRDTHLNQYEKRGETLNRKLDKDLCKPFEDAEKRAVNAEKQGFPGLSHNLHEIKEHVDGVGIFWKRISAQSAREREGSPRKNSKHTSSQESSNDNYRKIASEFAKELPFKNGCHFSEGEIEKIKASYLYACTPYSSSPKAAFAAAHADLCNIKAQAARGITFTPQFAESFSITSSTIRVLTMLHNSEE
ncbi:hypothetical protein SERLADRAFT_352904 [Serpula lacrymans var. lacrymans S7.9]|uniref:RNA-dependent RNA polymerase n=1 Tax=Serpula lacrymans var. lacrymans (strain S7.9) TaxID=578457 RepID=F8PCZ9_SERL9|nr:uncharacterized protein SERLADRAFT_352904 [Serpula lacrymans var. lacrymans S7.9]EGO19098.1 hypothetical protein SERLADRAFT_352904 [Serpula lacrymans var. lacrymans S7.9]